MTTTSSHPALLAAATGRGTDKEASVHLSRDESLALLSPLILELSSRISDRIALFEASSCEQASNADDLAALGWIQRCLEDVEATIIGLLEVEPRRFAALYGPAPSFTGGPPWPSGSEPSPEKAVGLRLVRATPGASGLLQITGHGPDVENS